MQYPNSGNFWEDNEFMAFLFTWPSIEAFTVVVSKEHYGSDCLTVPDDVLHRFILAAKKVSNVLLKHSDNVDRIGFIMEETGVDHAHIKLVLMQGKDIWKKEFGDNILAEGSDSFEKYKGYVISTDGKKADPKKLRDLVKN